MQLPIPTNYFEDLHLQSVDLGVNFQEKFYNEKFDRFFEILAVVELERKFGIENYWFVGEVEKYPLTGDNFRHG